MSHRFAAYVSLFMWIAVIVTSLFLWKTNSLEILPIETVYKEVCEENKQVCSKSPDVINIAVQLGRLDWVATSLAILGVGVGLLAIFSFLFTKEKAEIEARSTAKKVATSVSQKVVEGLIDGYKESIETRIDRYLSDSWLELEVQMKQNRDLLLNAEVSAEDADNIATSMEDD